MTLLIFSIGILIAMYISVSRAIKALRKEDFDSAKTWAGIAVLLVFAALILSYFWKKTFNNLEK
jgi:hypothetical protein